MSQKDSTTRTIVELLVISCASLYFELAVIRWLSSEIRIFAYFKNIPLMACLFGLGLGMALASRNKDYARWFPLGIALLTAVICLAGPLDLVHVTFINPLENYLIGSFSDGEVHTDIWYRIWFFLRGLAVLVGVFYLIVFTFVGMGQRIGQLLDRMTPLKGYSINVFASLLGILAFTLVSFISLSPPWWLVIGIVPLLFFYHRPHQLVAMGAALVLAFALSVPGVRWSPYYRISVEDHVIPKDGDSEPFHYGYSINVNYDTIQGCYDNRPEKLATLTDKQRTATADYYDTPYLALGDAPRSVLVLAAGTGNDVAAALRHGATEVDAVEIDPVIARLGKELHPEGVYKDPRVNVIVDDARAYLKRCKKKYDLIVFAYLDSHSAFSTMSSIRLDNYVYTRESFRDAYRLLKPKKGVMSVIFYYLTWWQLARVYNSLESGSGVVPEGVYSKAGNGPTLLVGPGVAPKQLETSGLKMFDLKRASQEFKLAAGEWKGVCATTDDWPYVFLRSPGLTWNYAFGLIFTLALGVGLVRRAFGSFTADATGRLMFFLGAAFMLIETKSVTQMGLLAGTTWTVNSAVITGVLLMILIANLIQIKYRFQNLKPLFLLLFASIVGNYFFELGSLSGLPVGTSIGMGSLVLCSPLLFASMIFAICFSRVRDISKALGMNLLGTLVGGAFEYFSMLAGIKALNLLAIALYGLAFYYSGKTREEEQTESGSESGPDSEPTVEPESRSDD